MWTCWLPICNDNVLRATTQYIPSSTSLQNAYINSNTLEEFCAKEVGLEGQIGFSQNENPTQI